MTFKEIWEEVITVLMAQKTAIDMNEPNPDIAAYDYSLITSSKAIRVDCYVNDEYLPSELAANNNYCTVQIFIACASNSYIEAKTTATQIALKVRKVILANLNPNTSVTIADFEEAKTDKAVVLVTYQKFIGDI